MAFSGATLVWRLRAIIKPPVSLGASLVVVDTHERVLLVRHTYKKGWYFPGGGVDPGESARSAALREVAEETGLTLQAPPEFFALYWNKRLGGRDHVALFVVRDVPAIDPGALIPQATEIAEAGVFPLDALPQGTTGAVRRRLGEVFAGKPIDETW